MKLVQAIEIAATAAATGKDSRNNRRRFIRETQAVARRQLTSATTTPATKAAAAVDGLFIPRVDRTKDKNDDSSRISVPSNPFDVTEVTNLATSKSSKSYVNYVNNNNNIISTPMMTSNSNSNSNANDKSKSAKASISAPLEGSKSGKSKSGKAAEDYPLPSITKPTTTTTTTTATTTTILTLSDIGNDGKPAEVFPLSECQGDCDKDSDCANNLVCYQRDRRDVVPGCIGDKNTVENSNSDYCVDPSYKDRMHLEEYGIDFDNIDTSYSYSGMFGPTMLRLFWHTYYYWQETREETFWCMQCRGGECQNGSQIAVNECSDSTRQQFIAEGDTIRANGTNLCMQEIGFNNESKPITLFPCNEDEKSQKFTGFKEDGPFQLRPLTNTSTCLTQHHHPKPRELVYPRRCEKPVDNDSSLWIAY